MVVFIYIANSAPKTVEVGARAKLGNKLLMVSFLDSCCWMKINIIFKISQYLGLKSHVRMYVCRHLQEVVCRANLKIVDKLFICNLLNIV